MVSVRIFHLLSDHNKIHPENTMRQQSL